MWKIFRRDGAKTTAVYCSRVVLTINATALVEGRSVTVVTGRLHPGRQGRSTDQPAAFSSKISAGKPRAKSSKLQRNVNKPVEPPSASTTVTESPPEAPAPLFGIVREGVSTEPRCLPRRDQRPMTPRASWW